MRQSLASTHVVLALLTCLPACKERRVDASLQADAQLSTTGSQADPEGFRRLFLSAVNGRNPTDFAQAQNFLAYTLPPALVQDLDGGRDDFLAKASQISAGFKPMDLYLNTKAKPLPDAAIHTDVLASLKTLRAQAGEPLFIIIIPGVFGEFIDARPFEDIFAHRNSRFAQAWQERQPQNTKDAANGKTMTMADLISTASLDDQGESLADVMLFNMPRLSFESLGSNADMAAVYLRRLEKVFQILGRAPKNIAILGYSRGTPLGLEILTQAHQQALPWATHIKAMLSLGGVVFGSSLADDTDNPASEVGKQIAIVSELVTNLYAPDNWHELSTLQKGQVIKKNFEFWFTALKKGISTLEIPKLSLSSLPSLAKQFAPLRRQLSELARVDPTPSVRLLALFWDEYDLWNAFGDAYPANITKFKASVGKILTAINELKTKSRLAWWGSHTVPTTGIRYYSLTATMADVEPLMNNPFTTIPNGPDDKLLLKNYQSYLSATQNKGYPQWLNDSQVDVSAARFWSKFPTQLNPQQAPLPVSFLGVVGASHWALALPEVTRLKDGKQNPFPRYELMTALAATVAADLTRGVAR